MFRHGDSELRTVRPAAVPVWTGPLRYIQTRWDQEITALREDAWQAYLRGRPDLAKSKVPGQVEMARDAFMSAFHIGSQETACRVIRILEYEEGFTEPMHHDAKSGVSTTTLQRITDEFGIEPRGKHA